MTFSILSMSLSAISSTLKFLAISFLRMCLVAFAFLAFSLSCAADDERFTVISVDTAHEKLELFLNDEEGKPFKRFEHLAAWLQTRKKQLRFAGNAGMYHQNFSPVGLLIQDGKQAFPLNQTNGIGNFFLKPNGVFLVSDAGPRVVESSEYPAIANGVRIATQSGPLLVRRGTIHPAFERNSSSRLIRNGVGVNGSKAYFVISERPVSFYELAIFFRDTLLCQDALYLDGVVSGLYSTEKHRKDSSADLGAMIGLIR